MVYPPMKWLIASPPHDLMTPFFQPAPKMARYYQVKLNDQGVGPDKKESQDVLLFVTIRPAPV